MSKVIEDISEQTASLTLTASGSTRWLAPELILGSVTSPTKQTDVYSFAMACLELLTGKQPWQEKKRDAAVIHDVVVLKKYPARPDVDRWMSDQLWDFLVKCWASNPNLRPSMNEADLLLQSLDIS